MHWPIEYMNIGDFAKPPRFPKPWRFENETVVNCFQTFILSDNSQLACISTKAVVSCELLSNIYLK